MRQVDELYAVVFGLCCVVLCEPWGRFLSRKYSHVHTWETGSGLNFPSFKLSSFPFPIFMSKLSPFRRQVINLPGRVKIKAVPHVEYPIAPRSNHSSQEPGSGDQCIEDFKSESLSGSS